MANTDWPSVDEIAESLRKSGIIEGSGRVVQLVIGGTHDHPEEDRLTCVADFDITADSLAPFIPEIVAKATEIENKLIAGECKGDKVEIGIYGGEVRVWGTSII